MPWLTFMYYFSYVKLVVTMTKYIPQAWFNYKRKSTRGWSIWMIYMDFCGGINGLLQMLFIAYNYDDWKTIFGNFAKFGLSVASISYDILFFLQEYVFYRKQDSSLQPLNEEKSFEKSERKKSRVSIVSLNSENTAYPKISHDNLGFHGNGGRKSVVSDKSYGRTLRTEAVSPPPPQPSTRAPPFAAAFTLKALNENYEKYLQSLPQKQKEYHNLVLNATKARNYPERALAAPLMLATQQRALIAAHAVPRDHSSRDHTPPHLQFMNHHAIHGNRPQQQIQQRHHHHHHGPHPQPQHPQRAPMSDPRQTPTTSPHFNFPMSREMALARQQSEIRLNRHLSVTTTTMTTPFTRAVHHSRPPVTAVATPTAASAANPRIPAVAHERAPPVRPSVLRSPSAKSLIERSVNCEQKRETIEKWKQISEKNDFSNSSQILSRVLRQKPHSRDIPEMLAFPQRHVTHVNTRAPVATISPVLAALAPQDSRPQNLANGHHVMTNRVPACHVTRNTKAFLFNPNNRGMSAHANRSAVLTPFSPKPLIEDKSATNQRVVDFSPELPPIGNREKNAPTIGANSVVFLINSRQQLREMPFVSTFSPVLTTVSPLVTKAPAVTSVATPVERDLNNNRVSERKSPEIVVLDDESRDSSQESEKSLKIDLKFDEKEEKEEKVLEKEVFEEKDDKKEQKEFDEEFEGFMKEFIQHLIESKKYIKESENERKSPQIDPEVTTGQAVERPMSHVTESEFVLCLDLIKARELRRKPIAYLNAKYPKNEISRSVYAGIRTKRAVMDFPKQLLSPSSAPNGEREAKRRRLSLRPTTPSLLTTRDDTTAADKWSSVLSCLDFSSPLSRRIVAVLPHFQHKD
ncbi:unnamed protein product [Medioppia subpectinata]|uniref:Cystinosin n=1 Tax=Medioppia subpectinata TaxID=1979941 RepID=A0A7R9PZQ4_9ACAR|nr:unnamed protein product [Medioppia subpectinata]CAG2107260.1 unnamed protein product [Medioppia subpectinata]